MAAAVHPDLPHVEDLRGYRPGGFHPIHIGDRLSKYTVVNKLGHGDTSTVWLARRDGEDARCVAVAVHMADISRGTETRAMTRWWRLKDGDPGHQGRANVLLPEDHFDHAGPNGTHFCIVFPVEGQTVSAATKRGDAGSRPLPSPLAKRVLRDMVRGLQYSHSMGLAHGDLHPANVLLGLPDTLPPTIAKMTEFSGPPKTVDLGSGNPSAPKYAVQGIFARDMDPGFFSGPAKIGDFSDSFFPQDPPARTAWCGPYVAPEFNSPGRISTAIDMWMLGCGFFEALTGRDLFGIKDDPAYRVVNAIMQTLGPPPESLLEDWRAYLGDERDKLIVPSGPPSGGLERLVRDSIGLSYGTGAVSEEELGVIVSLLDSLLVYEPKDRPTIEEVAEHKVMSFLEAAN
ncbi:CMGC/SRPK protein kinase [Gaeumannomyces tritici R3-111a-1]|uniref:non-specific serine/threonine protein kinase n=1 Tax=Gaeumannomyces tritici (strain R3-111a-1) TaxID=644352 RepID=J3NHL2_GAET3|nr:CMGC/SRPK protein kinase [Gaeumannomyces tritici R3-111a-1]EJT80755.1 CMGC/SRPK protein kinase [Gaeumannomyces tritici R3-111a-1]